MEGILCGSSLYLFSCSFHTAPNYSNSPVALVWSYYCEYLSTATADYVISVYHDKFVKLPWEEFLPDLASIEHMIKVCL